MAVEVDAVGREEVGEREEDERERRPADEERRAARRADAVMRDDRMGERWWLVRK